MKDKWIKIVWIVLMASTSLIDTYVAFTDFNWFSVIGAVCCGASAVLGILTIKQ